MKTTSSRIASAKKKTFAPLQDNKEAGLRVRKALLYYNGSAATSAMMHAATVLASLQEGVCNSAAL